MTALRRSFSISRCEVNSPLLDDFGVHDGEIFVNPTASDEDDEVAAVCSSAWYQKPSAFKPGCGASYLLARGVVVVVEVSSPEPNSDQRSRRGQVDESSDGHVDLVEDTAGVEPTRLDIDSVLALRQCRGSLQRGVDGPNSRWVPSGPGNVDALGRVIVEHVPPDPPLPICDGQPFEGVEEVGVVGGQGSDERSVSQLVDES